MIYINGYAGKDQGIWSNAFEAAQATKGIDSVLAIGGYPGINVPVGYDSNGVPFGIFFGGLKVTEPKLIEIAYGFEQATKIRKPPSFKPLLEFPCL
ncbi:hypothetical protein LWI28_019313 [Acer negundo]|uniref:Amidase n=1 Tax=Acer negundo TaxID=4023 RepID=A0AAD5J562_ACENE|nr:hypothetical protein LWI28_019313 [Acer negundo]